VSPNPGFMAQLELWGEMGCCVDEDHPAYKQFMLDQVRWRFITIHQNVTKTLTTCRKYLYISQFNQDYTYGFRFAELFALVSITSSIIICPEN
jgi:hypothetical protein